MPFLNDGEELNKKACAERAGSQFFDRAESRQSDIMKPYGPVDWTPPGAADAPVIEIASARCREETQQAGRHVKHMRYALSVRSIVHFSDGLNRGAVSYTHLTLPTIYSV